MALFNRIPTIIPVADLPFLLEVDFPKYAAHLAALSVTEPKPKKDAKSKPAANSDGNLKAGDFNFTPARLVGIQDKVTELRMILAGTAADNAAIYGDNGTGKNAVMEGFLRARALGTLSSRSLTKPFFLFDVNRFFADMARDEWVKKFKASIDYVGGRDGGALFENFADFIHTAGSEASRLVTCLISGLEHHAGLQAIYGAPLSAEEEIKKTSSGISRQFTPMRLIHEPGFDELKPIILGHITPFEEQHGVEYTNEAVDEIVRLLSRYPGRAFTSSRPGNAITFADRVGIYLRLNKYSEPPENVELREKMGVIRDEL